MAIFTQTISGYAIVPAWGGPDNFLNVEGRNWTDQQGYCQNDGRRFRIRGGRVVAFYAPVTNPVFVNDVRVRGDYAALTFELDPTALLTSFQVWDRTTNVFTSPPLTTTGNYRRFWITGQNAFDLTSNLEVQGNLAIRCDILATADSNVIFTGAGIRFRTPAPA